MVISLNQKQSKVLRLVRYCIMSDKNTLVVTQKKSPIGRRSDQEKTLIGLGLNKIGRSKVLNDTPSVRGMINKVKHLVEVN